MAVLLDGVYAKAIADLARLQLGNIIWFDRDQPVSELTLSSIRHVLDGLPKADGQTTGRQKSRDF